MWSGTKLDLLITFPNSELFFFLFSNRENILFGSPYPDKRLDIYLPPSRSPNAGLADGPRGPSTLRHRKHSTVFAEAAAPNLPVNEGQQSNGESSTTSVIKAPVVIFVPSPIPPLTWTKRRVSHIRERGSSVIHSDSSDSSLLLCAQKTYLQLALRLRRMGYCVVVPDVVSEKERF